MPIKITTLFIHNHSQSVKLPTEAYFPNEVKKVIVRIRGHGRIITPLENT